MNEILFQMYEASKKALKESDKHKDELNYFEEYGELIERWKETIELCESNYPDVIRAYEQRQAMYASFSKEQIDHICYQIGEWYLEWKERIIVDLHQGTHRLGFAKELLKTKICGD